MRKAEDLDTKDDHSVYLSKSNSHRYTASNRINTKRPNDIEYCAPLLVINNFHNGVENIVEPSGSRTCRKDDEDNKNGHKNLEYPSIEFKPSPITYRSTPQKYQQDNSFWIPE